MLALTFKGLYDQLQTPCPEELAGRPVPNAGIFENHDITGGVLFLIPNTHKKLYDISDEEAVKRAIKKGVILLVSEQYYPNIPCIVVKNVLLSFCNLAALHRSRLSFKAIAITGSNGKTTTREMTHYVLSSDPRYENAIQNPSNANARRQVATQLLSTYEQTQAAVIELGGGGKGDIHTMTMMVKPDIAAITMIGTSHIGAFGSREGLFHHKMEILDGMTKDGILILNIDSPFLNQVKQSDILPKIVTVSCKGPADFRAERVRLERNFLKFDIVHQGEYYPVLISGLGVHNATNILEVFAICRYMGLSPEQITSRLASFQTKRNRQNLKRIGPYTVIADCFNSSPESIVKGIEFLSMIDTETPKSRRIAVLSSMGSSLGDLEQAIHTEVGQQINKLNELNRLY